MIWGGRGGKKAAPKSRLRDFGVEKLHFRASLEAAFCTDLAIGYDDGVNGGIRYALTETEEKAAKAILRDSHITATVLSSILSVKKRQAERIIASLKKKAGLKRRGADKNGEWYFEGAAK